MKTITLIVFSLSFLSVTVCGFQNPPTSDTKTNHPKTANQHTDAYPDPNGAFLPDGMAVRNIILQRATEPLYRPPTKAELAIIAPNQSLAQRYAVFLREPHTGLLRLEPEAKCSEGVMVVSARGNCLKFTMPGGGSSYSFRTGSYRIGRLADITFGSNSFQTTGIMTHGIFVNLGDVPIESVTMQTASLRYLSEFQPSADLDEAKEMQSQLANGIIANGFVYSCALKAAEGSTYVLSTIAYRGKSLRSVDGVIYNELDFDKRKDLTIVFRVVNRAEDGSVTILWKRLEKKNAPQIKRPTKRGKPHKSGSRIGKIEWLIPMKVGYPFAMAEKVNRL